MKKVIHLAVLSTIATAVHAKPYVIYGEDNRQEVYEASLTHQSWARSAVTMISEKEMTRDPAKPGVVQLTQTTLRQWLEAPSQSKTRMSFSQKVNKAAALGASFCEGTKYTEQPNPGMCSGFLIAPDLIVTAGHCVEIENFCDEYRWVFDFQVEPNTDTAGVDVKEENIYKCKKVVSNALSSILGLDYGIIQLDRPVAGREPLELRNTSRVPDQTGLVVIGSPSGLPLKVAGGANVRKNSHPFFFSANLDTFQGNSGSAVFNAETGVVEGILVRGEEDYIPNMAKMCIEANQCANDSCRGEDVSRMTSIPEVAVQNALYQAAQKGDIAELERITKVKFWIDFYGKDGQSALMLAARVDRPESVEFLITKGADVNLRDASGQTALYKAILAKSLESMELLISAGTALNIEDNNGVTPLKLAKKVKFSKGKKLIQKALKAQKKSKKLAQI